MNESRLPLFGWNRHPHGYLFGSVTGAIVVWWWLGASAAVFGAIVNMTVGFLTARGEDR